MGVTYSSENTDLRTLRLPVTDVERLVISYFIHQYPPVMDFTGLRSLIYSAFEGFDNTLLESIMNTIQKIFQDNAVFYTQEILCTMALISDAPWNKRASILFDVFKSFGTEEMAYEDIALAAQVVATALLRVWGAELWEETETQSLCETIADNAFTKLEKELEEGIPKDLLVMWLVDRFRDSRTVATSESLKNIYVSSLVSD